MMRSYPTLFPLLLIILAIALAQGLKIDDQLEMNLELIKHQPCNFRPGTLHIGIFSFATLLTVLLFRQI